MRGKKKKEIRKKTKNKEKNERKRRIPFFLEILLHIFRFSVLFFSDSNIYILSFPESQKKIQKGFLFFFVLFFCFFLFIYLF